MECRHGDESAGSPQSKCVEEYGDRQIRLLIVSGIPLNLWKSNSSKISLIVEDASRYV
jgi:hypothetical protein